MRKGCRKRVLVLSLGWTKIGLFLCLLRKPILKLLTSHKLSFGVTTRKLFSLTSDLQRLRIDPFPKLLTRIGSCKISFLQFNKGVERSSNSGSFRLQLQLVKRQWIKCVTGCSGVPNGKASPSTMTTKIITIKSLSLI